MCMMKVLDKSFFVEYLGVSPLISLLFKLILIKYGQESSGKTKVPIVSTILFSSAISV